MEEQGLGRFLDVAISSSANIILEDDNHRAESQTPTTVSAPQADVERREEASLSTSQSQAEPETAQQTAEEGSEEARPSTSQSPSEPEPAQQTEEDKGEEDPAAETGEGSASAVQAGSSTKNKKKKKDTPKAAQWGSGGRRRR
jgi:hypothetical protein